MRKRNLPHVFGILVYLFPVGRFFDYLNQLLRTLLNEGVRYGHAPLLVTNKQRQFKTLVFTDLMPQFEYEITPILENLDRRLRNTQTCQTLFDSRKTFCVSLLTDKPLPDHLVVIALLLHVILQYVHLVRVHLEVSV